MASLELCDFSFSMLVELVGFAALKIKPRALCVLSKFSPELHLLPDFHKEPWVCEVYAACLLGSNASTNFFPMMKRKISRD